MQKIWALGIDLPFSAVDQVIGLMPEKSLGESAFVKDQEDRSADPIWVIQGFYKEKPDVQDIALACMVLATARNEKPYVITLGQVPVTGWLAKNQARYAPIIIGNFVIHDADHRARLPLHKMGIEMEVSCAFGTGEHPTTFGCLTALQTLWLRPGAYVLDLGTGSGVLALAAARLAACKVVASDLDAPSVAVAQANIRKNGLASRVRAVTANGFRSNLIQRNRPYDLILSNIFARPLARFAHVMTAHLRPGGHIILAGFLRRDEVMVRNAYMRHGAYVKRALRFGAWSVLILQKKQK